MWCHSDDVAWHDTTLTSVKYYSYLALFCVLSESEFNNVDIILKNIYNKNTKNKDLVSF